jgi:hypothetical protein
MAFDAFLKIDGIPGESTDDKHKDWIEILSFAHGLNNRPSPLPALLVVPLPSALTTFLLKSPTSWTRPARRSTKHAAPVSTSRM